MWQRLRGRQQGVYFRRQHTIGPYIADFFCKELNLIIELDGDTHEGKEAEDKERQEWLEAQGYEVIRYWNVDIRTNLDGIIESIRARAGLA